MMTGELVQHAYPAYNRRISIGSNTITDVQRISPVSNTAQQSGRTYFAGPSQQEFQRNANTTVKPVAVREAPKPGRAEVSGNAVNVYRPRVTQMEDARPSRVSKLEDVKPAGRNDGGIKPDVPPQAKPRGTDVQSRPRENQPAQTKPQSPRAIETPKETRPVQQPQPVEKPREMKPQSPRAIETPKETRPAQQPQPVEKPREMKPEVQPAPAPQQPRNVEPKQEPRQKEVTPPPRAPEQPRQIERQPRQPRQMHEPRQSMPRDMGQGRPMQPQGPPAQQQGPQPRQENGRKK